MKNSPTGSSRDVWGESGLSDYDMAGMLAEASQICARRARRHLDSDIPHARVMARYAKRFLAMSKDFLRQAQENNGKI